MLHEINAILESGAAAKKYNSQDFTKIYCIEFVKNILQCALSEKSLFVEGPSWQRVADAPSEGGGRAGGKNKRAFRLKIKG